MNIIITLVWKGGANLKGCMQTRKLDQNCELACMKGEKGTSIGARTKFCTACVLYFGVAKVRKTSLFVYNALSMQARKAIFPPGVSIAVLRVNWASFDFRNL